MVVGKMKPIPDGVTLSDLLRDVAYLNGVQQTCALTETLNSLDDCWVVDVESENAVSSAKSWFDTKVQTEENGIESLYQIVASLVCRGKNLVTTCDNDFYEEDFSFAKRLLALGIDPDVRAVMDSEEGTAGFGDALSHVCCYRLDVGITMCYRRTGQEPLPTHGRYKRFSIPVRVAKILGMCRPDSSLKGAKSMTPEELCRTSTFRNRVTGDGITVLQEMAQLWVNFRMNGFPTIAELCQRKEWWAVKNLCRRRVVPNDEVYIKFMDKDAVEWAMYYGEVNLARELRYLLDYEDTAAVSPSTGGYYPSLELVDGRVRELEEALRASEEAAKTTKEAFAAQEKLTEAFQDQVKNLEAKFAGLALVTRSTAAADQGGEKNGNNDSKEKSSASVKSERVPGLGLMTIGLRKLLDESFRTEVSLGFTQDLLEAVKKHRYTEK